MSLFFNGLMEEIACDPVDVGLRRLGQTLALNFSANAKSTAHCWRIVELSAENDMQPGRFFCGNTIYSYLSAFYCFR